MLKVTITWSILTNKLNNFVLANTTQEEHYLIYTLDDKVKLLSLNICNYNVVLRQRQSVRSFVRPNFAMVLNVK